WAAACCCCSAGLASWWAGCCCACEARPAPLRPMPPPIDRAHCPAPSFDESSPMTSSIPSRVHLIDVGPRDGLQNEKTPVPAAVKVELVHRLQQAGLKEIEVTSYVSPKWVPQMADNHEVMAGIARDSGVAYSVLTPNLKGYEAAVPDRPDEIVV